MIVCGDWFRLAASLVAEENENLHRNELEEGEEDADEDEEMILVKLQFLGVCHVMLD